jgi:hypothetical protein
MEDVVQSHVALRMGIRELHIKARDNGLHHGLSFQYASRLELVVTCPHHRCNACTVLRLAESQDGSEVLILSQRQVACHTYVSGSSIRYAATAPRMKIGQLYNHAGQVDDVNHGPQPLPSSCKYLPQQRISALNAAQKDLLRKYALRKFFSMEKIEPLDIRDIIGNNVSGLSFIATQLKNLRRTYPRMIWGVPVPNIMVERITRLGGAGRRVD